MFTVLVKKPNGDEILYACDTLEKEANAILLRGDNLGSGDCKGLEILGPNGATMSWDWDRTSSTKYDPAAGAIAGTEAARGGAQIFVMNSNGATVQRYSL